MKWLSLLIVLTLAVSLTSCTHNRYFMWSKDYKKIAEARFQAIITALNKRDSEAIKNMFSPNALKEAIDIDGGIEYLMEFYQGKIISKENGAQTGSKTNEHGKKTDELEYEYRVTTDVDKYVVFFIDKLVDTENKENIGLYMLQIIKQTDRTQQFDGGGKKTRCAGIYRPPVTVNE